MHPESSRSSLSRRRSNTTFISGSRVDFTSLPEDIFLQICFWLSVADVLSLRSANKVINVYTKNSNIWLALLRRLTIALPPAQPVLPTWLERNPRLTVEFSLTRALKLEQSWRDYNPLPSHYSFNGHQLVILMRFLPGGKHMVTLCQEPETRKEAIVVWDMYYRGRRNHIAVAMLNSETPIQKLHVRYACADGHICLFIAFTRLPEAGKTVISAVYVPLHVLEILSTLVPGSQAFLEYSALVPNPFRMILDTRTRYPVGAMSLSDIDGIPILAVVQRPRTVAFFDLRFGTRAMLKLGPVPGYTDWRHSIWDIRILASQHQVLVIRVLIGDVAMMDTNPLVFEIYDIPEADAQVENPVPCERRLILEHSVDGFFVSDGDASWNFRTHPHSDVPMVHKLARCPPPPISIFVTTKSPRGFLHFVMVPEVLNPDLNGPASDDTEYTYGLPVGTRAQYEWDEDEHAVILPGAYRSVVWMRSPRRQPPEGRAVIRLAVYVTEGYTFSDSSDTGHISSSTSSVPESGRSSRRADPNDDEIEVDAPSHSGSSQVIEHPRKRAMKYPVVPVDVAQAMRSGTRALQFDEWLGRLCIATTQDNYIQVLDWSI